MAETELDADTLSKLKNWWQRHYQLAGHKRLGRILMEAV